MFSNTSPAEKRRALREMVKESIDQMAATIVPGMHDAFSARIAASEGARAIFMTGAGAAASYLGVIDVGLTRMHDMVENAKHMADVIDVPLIVDADDGFGGPGQVFRAVREFEKAGISAMHIEDQTSPKRGPYFDSEDLPYGVLHIEEMVAKLRAAVAARMDENLMIFARCDARKFHGLEEVLLRCEAYLDAGADGLFPIPYMGPNTSETRADLEKLRDHFPGVPMLQASGDGMVPGFPPNHELGPLGVHLSVYATQSMCSLHQSIVLSTRHLMKFGSLDKYEGMSTYGDCNAVLGYPEYVSAVRSWNHKVEEEVL